jgi:hypothetical protein
VLKVCSAKSAALALRLARAMARDARVFMRMLLCGARNGGACVGAAEPLQRSLDRREVDVGVRQVVGEVGQHVERHLGHDFEDQAVIQARLAGGEQFGTGAIRGMLSFLRLVVRLWYPL